MFLLAALTLINLLIFIIVARWYKYKKPDFEEEREVPVGSDDEAVVGAQAYTNSTYQNDTEKKPWPPEYAETSRL